MKKRLLSEEFFSYDIVMLFKLRFEEKIELFLTSINQFFRSREKYGKQKHEIKIQNLVNF